MRGAAAGGNFFLCKRREPPAFGYTTGTCAAGAAGAAAQMLAGGGLVPYIFLRTPRGETVCLEVEDVRRDAGSVTCAVRKESGTDPDVTNGVLVYATVSFAAGTEIMVEGGTGVGRVTLPGLDQPVGSAAINCVPRQMIARAVRKALGTRGALVIISIPEGVELAQKTFNPRLGIVGGISVLGTSGIVEPMSERAILETIRVELNMRRAMAYPVLVMVPGNYGLEFLRQKYGVPPEAVVTCSNFVAETLDMAVSAGFCRIVFVGHIGKLVKVAAGMRNTHSRYGDHRMEILARFARRQYAGQEGNVLAIALAACVSTDDAVRVLREWGIAEPVLADTAAAVQRAMHGWVPPGVSVEAVMFSNVYGVLGKTERAELFLQDVRAYVDAREAER